MFMCLVGQKLDQQLYYDNTSSTSPHSVLGYTSVSLLVVIQVIYFNPVSPRGPKLLTVMICPNAQCSTFQTEKKCCKECSNYRETKYEVAATAIDTQVNTYYIIIIFYNVQGKSGLSKVSYVINISVVGYRLLHILCL